jgi:ABC-type dipeptide/oligopeptide/nickel transport system permease component
MQKYFIRRLLLAIPTVFGALTLVFFAMHLAPGDPIALFVPSDRSGAVKQEVIDELRHRYGFDKSLPDQYFSYLNNMAHLDFGRSMRQDTVITDDLQSRVVNTVQLGLAALVISTVFGILLGVIAAVKRGTWIDNVVMVAALLGISLPAFWFALILMLLFGLRWQVLPPSGYGGPVYTWDGLRYAILPVVTLGIAGIGGIARYTRSSLLEVINRDYVRTARAKGLKEVVVIRRHALRNGLLPVITLLGLSFGDLISGAVIIETVFGWPGLGRYLVSGINGRDFPVVQAGVLVIAVAFVLGNILTDLVLAYADPRIRLSR